MVLSVKWFIVQTDLQNFNPGLNCSKGGYRYPLDNSIGFVSVYQLDSVVHRLNNQGLDKNLGTLELKWLKMDIC